MIDVGNRQAERVQWDAHQVTPSSHFLEYIPGRDQLWTPEALRAGPFRAVLCCADMNSGCTVLYSISDHGYNHSIDLHCSVRNR